MPLVTPPDAPTKVTVALQRRAPGGVGELAWVATFDDVAIVAADQDLPANGPRDLMLWSGSITFAHQPEPGQFRVLITEREFVSANYPVVSGGGEALPFRFDAPSRIIYAETFELDSVLLTPPDASATTTA